jgi:hypothetical protein
VYDRMFGLLQERGVPVLVHAADPEEFWDPAQSPQWAKELNWAFWDGTYLTKEEIYAEVESVLGKFPRLKAQLAHFYFMSADLRRAADFLEKWPYVCFDLTPGDEMYVNFEKSSGAWRDFFLTYQDRIVYGTDNVAGRGSYDPESVRGCIGKSARIQRFLATADGYLGPGMGLALPEEAVAKITGRNFMLRTGGKPKKTDTAGAFSYCRDLIARMEKESGQKAVTHALRSIADGLERAAGNQRETRQ